MYTILVVDDSPFIVDVFVTMLERGGYRTVAAYGGDECLEILKTVTPDLILLDIMMEPMDGWETLERIKEDPATKEIPVLMLTAKQLTPAEAQEYGIYIEDYVLKPITHRELYDAIEHVLNRRQSIKSDMDLAKQSGFDAEIITEYARLSKSIDVNRRLMKILETTYNFNDSKVRVSDEISRAIKSMEMNIKFQENRLQQIKGEMSGTKSANLTPAPTIPLPLNTMPAHMDTCIRTLRPSVGMFCLTAPVTISSEETSIVETTILIVDDSPYIVDGLVALLKRKGFNTGCLPWRGRGTCHALQPQSRTLSSSTS